MRLTQSALTTVDNGSGMQRRELALTTSPPAPRRADRIGFAGVGIKPGLICEEVDRNPAG